MVVVVVMGLMVVVEVVVVAVVVVGFRCRGGQPKSEVKKLEGGRGEGAVPPPQRVRWCTNILLLLLLLLLLLWLLWVDGCC